VQNDAPLILVVEDNHEMNRFIVETLAGDYRVVSAYDGQEGVEKALALRPDLILTDLMMPVMGGDQLVAEIRRQGAFTDLPILVLTAKADEETRSNLLSSGVQDYLMKPFALAELRARINNLIATSRARGLLQEDLKTHQQDLGKLALEVKQRQKELQETLFALQISETRFRRVVESDMIGILFMSAEGRISGANHAFLNIIGQTSSEDAANELNLQELTPAEWRELDQIKIKEAVKNGASTHWEKEFLRKDGSRVPVLVGIAAIASLDAAKQLASDEMPPTTEFVAFVLDISERKRAERERDQLLRSEQSARHAAEDANRMKDEFLATVSHELRTPLTAMLGWIHMLHEESLDPQTQKRGIESIDRNCKAQAQIVDDLLDVSRIITGKLRLQTNEVEVHKVLEAAVDSLGFAAQAKNIELKLNLPSETDRHLIKVAGDFERLQQVVWNLLSNAVKFTGAGGGQINIRLKREGEQAVIEVQDTGEGIDPEFLPFVFDRFRQADGTSTRSHGGLGIGLSIVKHLVELHGGTVEADSAGQGHGATFRVRLPVLNKD
jgi:PAS domain S-box-containing protein